jgi:hypothetical protein
MHASLEEHRCIGCSMPMFVRLTWQFWLGRDSQLLKTQERNTIQKGSGLLLERAVADSPGSDTATGF